MGELIYAVLHGPRGAGVLVVEELILLLFFAGLLAIGYILGYLFPWHNLRAELGLDRDGAELDLTVRRIVGAPHSAGTAEVVETLQRAWLERIELAGLFRTISWQLGLNPGEARYQGAEGQLLLRRAVIDALGSLDRSAVSRA